MNSLLKEKWEWAWFMNHSVYIELNVIRYNITIK